MAGQARRFFSVRSGYRAMSDNKEVLLTYLTIVVGIVAHWVWEVLVAGISGGKGEFNFGPGAVILARVVIAFIAAAWSFTGIWQQLEGVDKKLRFFAAFTQAFAVEALTGPVVNAAAGE